LVLPGMRRERVGMGGRVRRWRGGGDIDRIRELKI
jgi:hypothetical protein